MGMGTHPTTTSIPGAIEMATILKLVTGETLQIKESYPVARQIIRTGKGKVTLGVIKPNRRGEPEVMVMLDVHYGEIDEILEIT